MPKRLGIFSIYDSEGVLDDATLATLLDLQTCLTYTVVAVNGYLQQRYLDQLSSVANQIVIRSNTGFDAGAYKDILFHHLTQEQLQQYDEFVLCNDTFYGPFVPFRNIFASMEDRDFDFWGLQYTNSAFIDFFPSYFLCYRAAPFFSDVLPYFSKHVLEDTQDINMVFSYFERGLFHHLCKSGYRFVSYAIPNNLIVYRCSNIFLEEYHLPILKKKCFDPHHLFLDNLHDALQYIARTYRYDITTILASARRKYGFNESKEQVLAWPVSSRQILPREAGMIATRDSLLQFLAKFRRVYIYGSGQWGQILYAVYIEGTGKMQGFVCSDEAHVPASGQVLGMPVYPLCDFHPDADTGMIVALGAENTHQIKPILGESPNLYYLY